ncbi:MAG TPA: PfkB family carbohydrate kinase [Bryobacteraceae bacterium]|nr:PfkB family carbohydrate kinase [Bryobacteraceae bacterium]
MTVAEILAALPRYSVLVCGDICLDRWCTYDGATAEPSRETGIPRIGVVSTEVTPGAGGTVANNVAALGIQRAAVLGVIGDDGFGYELTHALNSRGISTDLLVRTKEIPTFTYTKLINAATGLEDLPRVDFINTRPLSEALEEQIRGYLRDYADSFDIIFVSDQAETKRGGIITQAVREQLAELAEKHPDKVVLVDSRVRVERFRRLILKPNEQEAAAACIGLFGEVNYQRLRAHAESKLMFVTKGSEGVVVVEEGRETLVATRAIEKPVDICGAGDSFSAGLGTALAVTKSPVEAARFANLVASITIMKKGTGTASPEELLAAAAE